MSNVGFVQAVSRGEAMRKARKKYPKKVVVSALLQKPVMNTYRILMKPRKVKKRRK